MINLNSQISHLSYGIVSYYTLKYLSRVENVSFFPISNFDLNTFDDGSFAIEAFRNADKFDPNDPCLRIFHQFSMAESIGNGKRVGWSFFELDTLSEKERNHINSLDHFIVSSKWAKNICLENGIKVPISVICPAVDREIIGNTNPLFEDDIKRFLVVGKFEIRKCHDLIIRAFSEAFDIFDKVELHLMCNNHFNSKEENDAWINLIKGSKLANKVKLLPFKNKHREVLENYYNYDFFVGISRAEGFNLPLLEAMNAGCLCIASNNTAMSEYVTKDNCIMIESAGKVKAVDNKWFRGEGNWDEFNFKDIVDAFRQAYENKTVDFNKTTNAMKTANSFTWEEAIEKIREIC